MEQIIKQLNLEVLDTEIEKLPEKIGKYLKIIENSEAIEKSSKKKNCSEKQEINIEAMKIENLNILFLFIPSYYIATLCSFRRLI